MSDDPLVGSEPYEVSKARLELDSSWEGFKKKELTLTLEEAQAFKRIFNREYIHYEDVEAIKLVRKIMKFVDEN